MVQYGVYLSTHTYEPWADKYLPYKKLKQAIKTVVNAQKRLKIAEEAKTMSVVGQNSLLQLVEETVREKVREIRRMLDKFKNTINMHFIDVNRQIEHEKVELRARVAARHALDKQHRAEILTKNNPDASSSTVKKIGQANPEKNGQLESAVTAAAVATSFQSARTLPSWKLAVKAVNKAIATHRDVSEQMHELVKAETRLYDFAAVNYNAFYKILKKFKKQTKLNSLDFYLMSVEKCFFVQHLLEFSSSSVRGAHEPMDGENVNVDNDERRQLEYDFQCKLEESARVCEEALVILNPSMPPQDLQIAHSQLMATAARFVTTLSAVHNVQFKASLHQQKLLFFSTILETLESQFDTFSQDSAEVHSNNYNFCYASMDIKKCVGAARIFPSYS